MSIEENLKKIKAELPDGVRFVAVSKTRTVSEIMETYRAGQRIFGENRVQELVLKHKKLPKDIKWHMIGHLQTNKVKYIAPFISLIHSVDSLKLLRAIDKEAGKNNREINCLIQKRIAREETKRGLGIKDVEQILESDEYRAIKNIKITGLMGMATFTNNKNIIHKEFKYLKNCFKSLKEKYFIDNNQFRELSMGMSGDYKIAIRAGSTIIRVGGAIFNSA